MQTHKITNYLYQISRLVIMEVLLFFQVFEKIIHDDFQGRLQRHQNQAGAKLAGIEDVLIQ